VELAHLIFLELLDEAARYLDGRADDDRDRISTDEPGTDEPCEGPRYLDLALAVGFVLRTEADGWKLCCERLSIPAFAVWQLLPGFERLEHAMQLLEDKEFRPAPAFRPDGMLRWLSRIRPEGAPEPSMENLLCPERFADDLEKLCRQRVEWWGG
jgi:hypothetical protein